MINGEKFRAKVTEITQNLTKVKENISIAAKKTGRSKESIKLVAVTKLMPVQIIQAAIEAGLTCFGENYAEQAAEKIRFFESNQNLEWHMIGHIQSRKSQTVVDYFDMVHSLDRVKIARYLDRYAGQKGRVMPVLIEVNLSGEESKYGFSAYDEQQWAELIPQIDQISTYENLQIRGLMSMPPLFDNPELTRPFYRRLQALKSYLEEKLPGINWRELSIGTSFDYEIAVEEGATMVRIGSEIFGQRKFD